jgi:hypothetical protein
MNKPPSSLHPLSWRSLPTRVTVITLGIFIAAFWSMAALIENWLHRDLEVLLGEQQQATVTMYAPELNREIEDRLWRLPSQFPDAIAASAIVLEGSRRPNRRLAHPRINAAMPKQPFTPKAAP